MTDRCFQVSTHLDKLISSSNIFLRGSEVNEEVSVFASAEKNFDAGVTQSISSQINGRYSRHAPFTAAGLAVSLKRNCRSILEVADLHVSRVFAATTFSFPLPAQVRRWSRDEENFKRRKSLQREQYALDMQHPHSYFISKENKCHSRLRNSPCAQRGFRLLILAQHLPREQ